MIWATVCVTCTFASVCALLSPLAVFLKALARFPAAESTACCAAGLLGFAESCDKLAERPESAVAMSPPPVDEK